MPRHADRVKETTTTTGTGTLSLDGAAAGFQGFVAAFGTGAQVYYAIVVTGGAWEVGIGTITDATPDTLSRDVLLASSTGSFVSFGAGTKDVFATIPAYVAQAATASALTHLHRTAR